jgi:hypothetical protein
VISNSIVILSLLLAGGFWLAWLLRRDVRNQIEQPKHQFQDRVLQYDQQCHNPRMKE